MTVKDNAYPNGVIYLVPLIEITLEDVIKVAGSQIPLPSLLSNTNTNTKIPIPVKQPDYKSYFTNLKKYTELLKVALKNKDKRYVVTVDDVTNETPAFLDVVFKNIELIRKIFFTDVNDIATTNALELPRENAKLYIQGVAYAIRSSKVDKNTYIGEKDDVKKDLLPTSYSITFDLVVIKGDKVTSVDSKTCDEKAEEIDKDCLALFGKSCHFSTIFKQKEVPNLLKQREDTVVGSSQYLGPLQQEWEKRNKRDYSKLATHNKIEEILLKLLKLDKTAYSRINKKWLEETRNTKNEKKALQAQIEPLKVEVKRLQDMEQPSSYNKQKLLTKDAELLQLENKVLALDVALRNINRKYTRTLTSDVVKKNAEIAALEQKFKEKESELKTAPQTEKDALQKELDALSKEIDAHYTNDQQTQDISLWEKTETEMNKLKDELNEAKGVTNKKRKQDETKEQVKQIVTKVSDLYDEITKLEYQLQPKFYKPDLNTSDIKKKILKDKDDMEKYFKLLVKATPLDNNLIDMFKRYGIPKDFYDLYWNLASKTTTTTTSSARSSASSSSSASANIIGGARRKCSIKKKSTKKKSTKKKSIKKKSIKKKTMKKKTMKRRI
jgi:hypothetical protein